jgi:hypothetical protein
MKDQCEKYTYFSKFDIYLLQYITKSREKLIMLGKIINTINFLAALLITFLHIEELKSTL